MLKGETFFQTALRKINEETGNTVNSSIKAREILTVWNTYFSDSSWDEGRPKEEHGCQTVNVTVLCELPSEDSNFFVDETVSSNVWAVQAHKWVSVSDLLIPGKYDKYVRLNAELAVSRGLLQ